MWPTIVVARRFTVMSTVCSIVVLFTVDVAFIVTICRVWSNALVATSWPTITLSTTLVSKTVTYKDVMWSAVYWTVYSEIIWFTFQKPTMIAYLIFKCWNTFNRTVSAIKITHTLTTSRWCANNISFSYTVQTTISPAVIWVALQFTSIVTSEVSRRYTMHGTVLSVEIFSTNGIAWFITHLISDRYAQMGAVWTVVIWSTHQWTVRCAHLVGCRNTI